MTTKKEFDEIKKSMEINIPKTIIENHVPVIGDIVSILDKVMSDKKITDRFNMLNEKMNKISPEDLKKLKNITPTNAALLKIDLYQLISLYLKSMIAQRREYLANAIVNVTTLKNYDYQQNSFFISILNTIPDISIEFLERWKLDMLKQKKYLESEEILVSDTEFEELKKKYDTSVDKYSVIVNCESIGLLVQYDINAKHEEKRLVYEITQLGREFLKFIENN